MDSERDKWSINDVTFRMELTSLAANSFKEALTIAKHKKIFQLKNFNFTHREIAEAVGCGRNTLTSTLAKTNKKDLNWLAKCIVRVAARDFRNLASYI